MTMSPRAQRSYLEMRTPAALRPSRPVVALAVTREQPCAPELYRRLYLERDGAGDRRSP